MIQHGSLFESERLSPAWPRQRPILVMPLRLRLFEYMRTSLLRAICPIFQSSIFCSDSSTTYDIIVPLTSLGNRHLPAITFIWI